MPHSNKIISTVAYTAILSVITLLLFIVAGESYSRFVCKPSYLTGFIVGDSVFHHIIPPHFSGAMHSDGDFDVSFETNNMGLRGPGDYSYEKPDGLFRMAVLGDSFVFGVGVKAEETASAVLERLLNGRAGKRYEVYNFGVNSYSPTLEYIFLKKELIKYHPDLVILMLDISDIQDDYGYEPHTILNEEGDVAACNPFVYNGRPDIRTWLMKHSRLFFVIDQKVFESFRKMRMLGFRNYILNKFKGVRNKKEILTNRHIDNIYFDKFLMFRDGKDESVVSRHWDRTAKYLLKIKQYLDRNEIRFVLVIYPYGQQVGESQWAKGRVYWAFDQGKVYDPGEGFARIEKFASANGITLINLYGALVKNNYKTLYFNSDGHWTPDGQETAAKAIFDSGVCP